MSLEAPEQPSMEKWHFIEDLKSPLHKKISWKKTKPGNGEADLSQGVSLNFRFPDSSGVLDTAFNDFRNFLKAGNISDKGSYRVITEKAPTSCFEEYSLEAGKDSCRITANDTEGIRRALVFLEDEILSTGGSFLKIGKQSRKPLIRTRISRCFFGPIKRPPMNRDELGDDVNYYPDEYLNRLAHEGINALWLTVKFEDLCTSRFFPDFGKDKVRRLEKLRATVKQCARYGIKIYIFCIEPQGFGDVPEYLHPMSYLENNEYFRGNKLNALQNFIDFCVSTPEGKEFLEESAYSIFSDVPGLGGLIDINLGERPTNCYSCICTFFKNNCPRCSKRQPWEVIADTSSAIVRGMKKANPDAEMVSWLYVPYIGAYEGVPIEQTKDALRNIAAHTPKDVTLQFNFESNGEVEQLGKTRIALDYWLAWPGPSKLFEDCAKNAVKAGARMSAKIQVGCSHEVATIPFIPVPGNLYRKYKAMHELGVSTVMQCWYFGSYPGLMNKAAGELSFAPFPETEEEFLTKLARKSWTTNEDKIVKAWYFFREGYSNFPVNLPFTWYGPLHNSITWPLHLIPVDKPIAPSWKFTFPLESGDRIGECISFGHTLTEVLTLLDKMNELWQSGVDILNEIKPAYAENEERLLDIGLAEAIGLQIKSADNIFHFYDMREKLPFMKKEEQSATLKKMEAIARQEIENSLRLKELCIKDSRLGFHSEAEGYKYFPANLEYRAEHLKKLLAKEFPLVGKTIEEGKELFPEYTGTKPQGKIYRCGKDEWADFEDKSARWSADYDKDGIVFKVTAGNRAGLESVVLEVEHRRLWPVQKFEVFKSGLTQHHSKLPLQNSDWRASLELTGNTLNAEFKIPFSAFTERSGAAPLRINIYTAGNDTFLNGWIKKNPWEPRLFFGDDNPEDLGWFFFE